MQVPAWVKDCMTWGLQKSLISPQDCIGEKEMSEYAFTHAWQEGIR